MSSKLPDAGNVGITSSGVTAAATAGSGAVGWLNENAMIIGIVISLISLIVGIIFKTLSVAREERHHREKMLEDAKQNAQAMNMLRDEIRAELRGEKNINETVTQDTNGEH